jgi:hypothetical protein
MTKPMCGTCRFANILDSGVADCRRLPPSLVPWTNLRKLIFKKEDGAWCAWPRVSEDDFCGEHQPITPETTP